MKRRLGTGIPDEIPHLSSMIAVKHLIERNQRGA